MSLTNIHNNSSVESALNGKKGIDPKDAFSLKEAAAGYVTTPGITTIPACGRATAVLSAKLTHQKHGDVESKPNYFCDAQHQLDYCGASTFVDQTSGASPSVEDCLELLRRLDDPTDFVDPGSSGTVPLHG